VLGTWRATDTNTPRHRQDLKGETIRPHMPGNTSTSDYSTAPWAAILTLQCRGVARLMRGGFCPSKAVRRIHLLRPGELRIFTIAVTWIPADKSSNDTTKLVPLSTS